LLGNCGLSFAGSGFSNGLNYGADRFVALEGSTVGGTTQFDPGGGYPDFTGPISSSVVFGSVRHRGQNGGSHPHSPESRSPGDPDVWGPLDSQWGGAPAHRLDGGRFHSAPGHDPHSVVLFNEEDRILISADALWENGFGVVFPEIEGVSAFDEVEQTLNIIENLAPQIVLPGHGSAFADAPSAIARARSRLAQFRSAPDKHASYASKVLLKFKLLELQRVEWINFLDWAEKVTYLHLLHQEYAGNIDYRGWILFLCKELEKSGACQLTQESIINT
jgi:glyoxylase-like metal-dependent hydrolase (beta-lactamase superfamily II)